ncbi:MAG: 4'-phosphopantetheinyl transferase superfamily protein [Polyangiaceae bacterium]|nr:4'-phosphopantetheinyl transferase superfamily protein [Polyangiaceae bacterium]
MLTSFGTIVSVSLADALGDEELHPEERAFLRGLEGARRATWLGGRIALRRALAAVGVSCDAILADDRGAPHLPARVRGSISHKETIALALATTALDDDHVGVGVDVEYDRPLRVDIAKRVLTTAELASLERFAEGERDHVVRVAFALKEAVYKAIDPACRRYVGFREVELDFRVITEPGEIPISTQLAPDPGPLAVRCAWSAATDASGEALIVATATASRMRVHAAERS